MMCCYCEEQARRHGRDRKGNQRYRCGGCGRTFQEAQPRLLGDMRIDYATAVMALKMLAEGCSVRAVSRLTDLHKNTVTDLLLLVGRKAEKFMESRIQNVPVKDVQLDEMWGFIGMKERTKKRKRIVDPYLGDSYLFIGIERHSKLVLAWHLGRRTVADCEEFLDRLHWVTANRFQVSTDGWSGYQDTVHRCLGAKADFATIEKEYASPAGEEGRYSPPTVVGCKKTRRYGSPVSTRVCTSHVERLNCSVRQHVKRLARLTLAFSKKWENLRAAVAWHFCYYNFCRIHSSIKVTPAMEAKVTDRLWSVEDILEAAATL